MKKCVLFLAVTAACALCSFTAQAQLQAKARSAEQAEIEQLTEEYIQNGVPAETAKRRAESIVRSKNGVSLRSRSTPPPTKSILVARDPVINTYTPEQLVKKVLLGDARAESAISNVIFYGLKEGAAWASTLPEKRSLVYFENGAALGIEKGLLLTTGPAGKAEGHNSIGIGNSMEGGSDHILTSDPQLAPLTTMSLSQGSVLEFEFKPYSSKISFDFICASEEFPEWSNTVYNDVFGFFIWDKEDPTKYKNIALFPDGTTPVAINNSNWGHNSSNNTSTGFPAPLFDAVHPEWHVPNYVDEAGSDSIMEYDGRTILLTAVADSLDTQKTYHLRLAISNVGSTSDVSYGSGVFLSNLDLGFPEAGVDSPYKGSYDWPEEYDLLGLDQWYANCPQTLTLKFTPNPTQDRTVELKYLGLAEKYLVDAEGKALPAEVTLESGDSIIALDLMTLTVPETLEGQTGSIVANVLMGGSDTTDFFKFYNRPTYSVDYVLPTAQYAGKLDIHLKGGSPKMFRTFNGGITWESAWAPITQSQIANLGLKGQIVLKEPNSCFDVIVPIEKYEGSTPIVRRITVPRLTDADIYPPPGAHFAESLHDFTVTVHPTGVNAGRIPVITTGRALIPDSVGVELKSVENGVYTFVIHYIQQAIDLKIDFVSPSASASATVSETEIWGGSGQIYFSSPQAGEAKIYGISGSLLQSFTLPAASKSSITLPAGLYVVSLNGMTYKVVVR
jgi:hypothetical protein